MKMKNREIMEKAMRIAEIINKGEKYPVKFSFALQKNYKGIIEACREYQESRDRLLDEYNVKDESGKPKYKRDGRIDIKEEYADIYEKEANELLDIEVDIKVHKVPVQVLDGMEIAPYVLVICDFMIEE